MQINFLKTRHYLILVLTCPLMFIHSTFVSCSQKKQSTLETLLGHWHLDGPFEMTLDIDSSSVEINKYSFIETQLWFPLFDSASQKIMLPIPCGHATLPSVDNFSFHADTLIYDREIVEQCSHYYSTYRSMKFVRGDIKKCKWEHTLKSNSLNVELAVFPMQTSPVVNFDSLRRVSLVSTINIGTPKQIDRFGQFPKIQVNDVFVEPSGIKQFIQSEKAKTDSEPIVLCLNVDNTVPAALVEEVISFIPKNTVAAIYRLVTLDLDEKKYGYQKMYR